MAHTQFKIEYWFLTTMMLPSALNVLLIRIEWCSVVLSLPFHLKKTGCVYHFSGSKWPVIDIKGEIIRKGLEQCPSARVEKLDQ